MSFGLVKLLSLLVYPLSGALFASVLALLLAVVGRRSLAWLVLVCAGGWLYLCSTAWFADRLQQPLEAMYPPQALAQVPDAPVIVVLGGSTFGDGLGSNRFDLGDAADRLLYAAELYHAGKAPRLLLSGGADASDESEAYLMSLALQTMQVPEQALWLEDKSRNTQENAQFSAALLKASGVSRILLVTSATHMRRAVGLFEAQGSAVHAAAADYQVLSGHRAVPPWLPTVHDLERSSRAIHEYVGFWVSGIRGR